MNRVWHSCAVSSRLSRVADPSTNGGAPSGAVEATDGVVATCPKVSGSALAYRGAAEEAVKVVGADADRLRQIVDLRAKPRRRHLSARRPMKR